MFFGQALSLSRFFATHPPLEERMRRINPRFQPVPYRARRDLQDEKKGAETPKSNGRRAGDVGVAWGRSAAESAALVGTLDAAKVDHAGTLLDALPAGLREALREPERAAAAVASLLAAAKADVLEAQLGALRSAGLGEMVEPVRAGLPLTQGLSPAFHLAVVDLALPALKSAPEEAKKRLIATLQTLAYADRRLSLHEFVLLTLLRYQLAPATRSLSGKKNLSAVGAEAGVLIAVIAHAGTRVDTAGERGEALEKALAAGTQELGLDVQAARDASLSLEAVSAALEAARELAPLEKARLVKGLFAAVTADGTIRLGEAELMRLVGAVLDCPLPPLIETLDPRRLVP